ncbi:MAG TPA: hypothetical protein PLC79_07235, partial [Phycisphaerae bacterium]|nr:hypothetical protein [Phycisphaerae bacterium]
SKDEILAVAYHRAFIMPGAISPWLFWVPILIAYVTPFYMMRCWWLTFMGRPRDHHVHEHAHESPLMYIPLIVLAAGTFVSSYAVFRPMVEQAAPAGFLVPTFNPESHATAGDHPAPAVRDEHPARLEADRTHAPGGLPVDHHVHAALMPIVGFAFVIGFAIAIAIYRRGLDLATTLATRLRPLHTLLVKKFYFDEVYGAVFVGGVMALRSIANWIDVYIVDGLVNAAGWLVRLLSLLAGDIFDRAGAATSPAPAEQETAGRGLGFVACVVVAISTSVLLAGGSYRTAVWVLVAAWLILGIDGIVNDLACGAWQIAGAVRRPQTGRIRNYVLFAAGGAAVVLMVMILL